MAPKSSSSLGKPHLTEADFNQGKSAAARFKAAVGHLASLPKSAAPAHTPAPPGKTRKKK
jgi:hypothetical protein